MIFAKWYLCADGSRELVRFRVTRAGLQYFHEALDQWCALGFDSSDW